MIEREEFCEICGHQQEQDLFKMILETGHDGERLTLYVCGGCLDRLIAACCGGMLYPMNRSKKATD